jgi:hypothetical protein
MVHSTCLFTGSYVLIPALGTQTKVFEDGHCPLELYCRGAL